MIPLAVLVVDSPLGPISIGANEDAVWSVEFSDANRFESHLSRLDAERDRSPNPGSLTLASRMAGELERYFQRELQRFKTPIRLAGTPFERAVWEELLRIPFGETLSYAALAHRVGDPKATRAVGRANGANPLAIVVPCHRVVETGGGLGGYGGGLDRKRFLLDLESGQEALNYDLQNLENDSSDRGGEPRPQSGLGL